jgi:hypothetical protein
LALVYEESYPWWLGTGIVVFPALSLLGATLLRPSADLHNPGRKRKALASTLLTGLALVGMLAIGAPGYTLVEQSTYTSLFAVAYLGVWLMLIGLGLVLLGTILRSGRVMMGR